MQTAVLVIHVLLAIALTGLVLMQQGKGADAGAAFGSGSSATVFGAGGSGSFLTRLTTGLAALFFVTSLTLAMLAANRTPETTSVVETVAPASETSGAAEPTRQRMRDVPTQSGAVTGGGDGESAMPPINE